MLSTLSSDSTDVRHTAAMVVAKVAAIELPHKQWPDLVTSLINNMGSAAGLKQATLEALGYICEEMAMIKEEVLTPAEVNMILTAVVAGMRPDEPSQEIRLAATTALSNAVEFAEHNFENEQERNYIMQMVCQGTVAPNPKIRVESFFCLHEIAAGYYRHLPAYMQEIFNITVNAIKNEGEDEDVRLQVGRLHQRRGWGCCQGSLFGARRAVNGLVWACEDQDVHLQLCSRRWRSWGRPSAAGPAVGMTAACAWLRV